MVQTDITVDASHKVCPVPIIELAKALRKLTEGEVVALIATDPAAAADVRAFCSTTGHQLLEVMSDGGFFRAWIRKVGQTRRS